MPADVLRMVRRISCPSGQRKGGSSRSRLLSYRIANVVPGLCGPARHWRDQKLARTPMLKRLTSPPASTSPTRPQVSLNTTCMPSVPTTSPS